MSSVVLDHWALLYWTLCPQRLTAGQQQALEQAHRVLICSVLCWQMQQHIEAGSLNLGIPLEEFWRKLASVERVEIVAPQPRHWLEARRAPAWMSSEDRLVVALARLEGCALLSPRSEIALA